MRFEDKFQYSIHIADDVDIESIEIPPMLLQPYVENCILHGILPSDKSGQIDISVEINDNQCIVFSIQDNGIGIEESIARKLSKKSIHVSRGTSINAQRIQLLEATKNINIQQETLTNQRNKHLNKAEIKKKQNVTNCPG